MSIEVDRDPAVRAVTLDDWQFELCGDELAALRHRGSGILRAIRFVVRDGDWRTVPARVTDLEVTDARVAMALDFDAWGIRLSATITAQPVGESLRVELDAMALTSFLKNRVGLVVLHHVDDAGATARVTDARGVVVDGAFPVAISPHQPFAAISRFEWRRNGADVALAFEGEVFEMEDQRNWTDASFKTYSTPLSEPYPAHLLAGDRVRQAVTVSVDGAAKREADAAPMVLESTPPGTVVPTLGTLLEHGSEPGALAGWPLGFLQVEVVLGDAGAASAVDDAVAAARGLGIPLDLRVVAAAPHDLRGLDQLLARVPEGACIRFGTFDSATHIAEPALREGAATILASRADATAVAGTRAHFAELNRTRERLPADASAVTFSLTPTMHAYEIAHVRDSLATLPAMVAQAAELAHDALVHVGPITLEPRFNAVATSQGRPTGPGIDDTALYAHPIVAAWVLAAVIQLAGPATASVSIFRATGRRGLVNDGTETPAGNIVRRLAELTGAELSSRHCDRDLVAAAIGGRLFVANLTGEPISRDLATPGGMLRISLPAYGVDELAMA